MNNGNPDGALKLRTLVAKRYIIGCVIDSNGEIILECIYDEIAECYGEFIKAKKDGAYGLMLDSLRVCSFLYDVHLLQSIAKEFYVIV